MSGFMKTTRLGSSISRLGVRAGGPTVAGPVVPGAEGNWAVEVWDVEGRVLARHEFRCESGATS